MNKPTGPPRGLFTLKGNSTLNISGNSVDDLPVITGNDIRIYGSNGAGSTVKKVSDTTGTYTEVNIDGGGTQMTRWRITGDSGAIETVTDGNTVTIAGTNGISTVGAATDTVNVNLNNTAVAAGSYTSSNITVDSQGRITTAASGASEVAGSNNQIQYNDGGTFGADSDLTYTHSGAKTLSAPNFVATGIGFGAQGGSNITPSFTFVGDLDTGMYAFEGPFEREIGFSANATLSLAMQEGTFEMQVSLVDGSSSAPSLTFISDQDTGMFRVATNTIGFSTGGVQKLTIAGSSPPTGMIEGINVGLTTDIAGIRRFSATADDSWEDGVLGNSNFLVFGPTDLQVYDLTAAAADQPQLSQVTFTPRPLPAGDIMCIFGSASAVLGGTKLIPKGFRIKTEDEGVILTAQGPGNTGNNSLGVNVDISVWTQSIGGNTPSASSPGVEIREDVLTSGSPQTISSWAACGSYGIKNDPVLNTTTTTTGVTTGGVMCIVKMTTSGALTILNGGICGVYVAIERI